jgi:hypothetical protein
MVYHQPTRVLSCGMHAHIDGAVVWGADVLTLTMLKFRSGLGLGLSNCLHKKVAHTLVRACVHTLAECLGCRYALFTVLKCSDRALLGLEQRPMCGAHIRHGGCGDWGLKCLQCGVHSEVESYGSSA